jgi:hypothetical protein
MRAKATVNDHGRLVLRWVIVGLVVALSIANFIRIDDNSHSASGTLLNWIPQTAALAGLAWFGSYRLIRREPATVRRG